MVRFDFAARFIGTVKDFSQICRCLGGATGVIALHPRPPSLRAAIRPGIVCSPTRFRLCISAWRSPASARISRRETCRRRGSGDGSPCSAARWRCSSRFWSNVAWGSRCARAGALAGVVCLVRRHLPVELLELRLPLVARRHLRLRWQP